MLWLLEKHAWHIQVGAYCTVLLTLKVPRTLSIDASL
jgi:hypothetical protein